MTGSNSYTGTTSIAAGGTLEFNSTASQTLSGNVAGGVALFSRVPGTLALANTNGNSFNGNLLLNGGVLNFVNGDLGASSAAAATAGYREQPGCLQPAKHRQQRHGRQP